MAGGFTLLGGVQPHLPVRFRTTDRDIIRYENFFTGAAIPVDAIISGGGQATIQFATNSRVNPISFQWQWSAAAYTFWSTDWNQAGIQPFHGNGLHADTPTNPQVQHSDPRSARSRRLQFHWFVERNWSKWSVPVAFVG